jgi:hypothetical protein
MWLDSRSMTNTENRPRVVNDAMEYLIVSIQAGWSNHFDFARLDPKGEFFLRAYDPAGCRGHECWDGFRQGTRLGARRDNPRLRLPLA